MKYKTIVAIAAFGICSVNAHAATTCVFNSGSGKFESKGAFDFAAKSGTQCDLDNSLTNLRDVQARIKGEGTILANVAMLSFPDDSSKGEKRDRFAEQHAALASTDTVQEIAPGAPTPAEVPAQPVKVWKINLTDKSVRALLDRWCKEEGYQLLWEISVDLELGATADISGTFEEALNSVLASLSTSDYPVEAMMYENRVVRVVKHIPGNK